MGYISDTSDGFAPNAVGGVAGRAEEAGGGGRRIAPSECCGLSGDEVYPAGNHDWYGGLTAFIARSVRAVDWGPAGSPDQQLLRALQLPHRW
jgi:hypothetical protein